MSARDPKEHAWEPTPDSHPEPVPLASEADLINPLLVASDVMAAGPRTCSSASSVLEAVLIFRDADCGAVPVTDAGRPVGILTDRDVALALADRDGNLAGVTVGDLMTPRVATIAANSPLDDVIRAFGDHGVRRLLVVGEGGTLAGVLSWTDLVGHIPERGLGRVVARIEGRRRG